jgi:hypothetical protein
VRRTSAKCAARSGQRWVTVCRSPRIAFPEGAWGAPTTRAWYAAPGCSGAAETQKDPNSGQLLALVDALHIGTLNDAQRETVQALRMGILALAQDGNGSRAQTV